MGIDTPPTTPSNRTRPSTAPPPETTPTSTPPASSSTHFPSRRARPSNSHRTPLECPICLQLLSEPAIARCGHSFCAACIAQYRGHVDKRRRGLQQQSSSKPCPVCETSLGDSLFPNVALAQLASSAATPRTHAQHPAHMSALIAAMSQPQLDSLLAQLLERRKATCTDQQNIGMQLVRPFLERCRRETRESLQQVTDQLSMIDHDLNSIREKGATTDALHVPELAALPMRVVSPDLDSRMRLVSQYHKNIKAFYFEQHNISSSDALSRTIDTLVDATSMSTGKRRVVIQHIDILRSNHNLISSIEFNSSATLFATAGVTKRIKLFDFNSIVDSSASADSATHHYPILEVVVPSKLSCLSWSRERQSLLAASTYKGDILIHDTETNTQLHALKEHTKRTWYVDFSTLKPNLLLSASDDKNVKLWDVERQQSSTMTLQTNANVCCVKFNPYDAHEIAFGSADHNVYSYDIRHPSTPLCVFEGHWRAVSHVLFLNRSELISASTDSSCKLWNVKKQQPGLSYTGHTNDRNFVGLSGSKDFFACGSEDNSIYVYHKGFAGPIVRYAFGSHGSFVSTVTWKADSNYLVAANNTGSVEILELT